MEPASIIALCTGLAGLITAIVTARSSVSKSQISDMEETVETVSKAFGTLKTMNEMLQGEVKQLRAENEELREELKTLKNENNRLRVENRKLTKRVKELEERFEL